MSSTEPEESLVPRKRSHMDNETEKNDAKKSKNCTERLKLTDMNDHCLVDIFKSLNLQDLVNIAETGDRFVNAAILAFSSIYCRTKRKAMLSLGRYLARESKCVGLNDSEAFFRHFGHSTSRLTINFAGYTEDVDIIKYLREECTESLVDLVIYRSEERHFGAIDAVFPNVLNLEIFNACLGEKMCQLKTWFPNLEHLELVKTHFTHPKLLKANFPNLMQLKIYDEDSDLSKSTLVDLFRLNPQLGELELGYDYDVSLLQSMKRSLPHLEKLKLWSPGSQFERFTGSPVVFETVKSFELELPPLDDSFDHTSILIMPFRFTKLEKLTIDVFKRLNCLLPFIQDCSAVELTLKECSEKISFNDLSDVMNNLPSLVELRFCVDDIVMAYPLEGGIGGDVEDDNEDGDDIEDDNEDGDDSEDDNEDGDDIEDDNEDGDIPEEIDWIQHMSREMFMITMLLRMNTRLQKIHLMFPNSGDRSAYCDIVGNGVLAEYKVLARGCDSCTEAYHEWHCLCLERKNPSSSSYNDTD